MNKQHLYGLINPFERIAGLKALLWEGDGFLLFYKRLETGRFSWPRNEQEVRNLTREQFVWLMQSYLRCDN